MATMTRKINPVVLRKPIVPTNQASRNLATEQAAVNRARIKARNRRVILRNLGDLVVTTLLAPMRAAAWLAEVSILRRPRNLRTPRR